MSKLKAFREAERLTRTELAAKIGVSERYIFFLESGDRTPSLKVAQAIATELGVNIEDIFLPIKCTKCTFDGRANGENEGVL